MRILFGLFFCLAMVVVTGAQAVAREVRLVSSDETGVLLEVDAAGYGMRSVRIDGQRFDRIDLPDGVWLPEAGRPAVPVRSALVGIPYGARVSVAVVDAEYEEVEGVELMPVPGAVGEGQVGGVFERMHAEPNPEFYAQDRFFPAEQAVLSRVGVLRDQRVAAVSLRPIQYNPARNLLRVARRLRVRVQFTRSFEQQAVRPVRPDEDEAFETLYRNALLNAEQARAWRGRAVDGRQGVLRKQAGAWYDPAAVYYKVRIREDGLHRLDAAWFENSGILLQPGDLDRMKLFLNGEERPLHVRDGGDGRLDEGEGVYFYGSFRRAPDRDFEHELGREQVYWLTLDGEAGRRFVETNAAPASGFPQAAYFQDRAHAEVDSIFDPLAAAPDADRDHWFWARTGSPGKPGTPFENVNEFPVTVRVPLPGLVRNSGMPGRVRVGMHGLTFREQFAPDHRTVVRLGNTVVADDRWDGKVAFVAGGEVPASVLNDTTAVTLATPGAPDFPDTYIENVLLNWVEITYSRRYEAAGGRLTFEPGVTEGRTFSIGGFGSPQVQVYDLEGGRVFSGVAVGPQGTGYRAQFELANPSGRFLAVDVSTARRPEPAQPDAFSDLRGERTGAEYVVITTAGFQIMAEQLADHRRAGGLSAMVVDVNDIYDEFSFGQFEPEAIRQFVQHAFETWDRRPTYLLLFGRASFDYRDLFDQARLGRRNHVPALPFQGYSLATLVTRGYAFTDHFYGTVAGDDPFQDVFVGRLSVNNTREAETVVRKTTGYDLAGSAPWQDRVLYMANYAEGNVYANVSDSLAAHTTELLGLETFRVYNQKDTPPEPNEDSREVIRQINEGRLVVNYIGHGSVASMQNFLRGTYQQQDYNYMNLIRNEDRLPLVVAMTCLNGQFADPRFACLAEEMTVKSNGGAIAYVSSSELGLTYANNLLNRKMFRTLFIDGNRRTSVALALAKVALYADAELLLPSLYAMNLIGDPAQELRVPSGPDFVLEADGLQLERRGPLTVADSTRVRIRLVNRGIAPAADVRVLLLDRNLDRGEVDTLFSGMLPPFGQEDSVTVYWRLADRAGRHLLEAVVDPDDRIAELNENNNQTELEAEVFGTLHAVVTTPRQSQVVSAAAAQLAVRAEDGAAGEVLGEFEVNRSPDFGEAGVMRSGLLGGENGLVRWQPAGLSEGTYFWRARLSDGQEAGAWTPVQMFEVSSSVPEGELVWRQSGTEALQLGVGADVTLDGNGHVARVQTPPPMRFTAETREISFPAQGVSGTGTLCADGTYVYVSRFYSSAGYPGKDVFERIGTGFGGTAAGQNFGVVSETEVRGISAAYHSDGFIYADDGQWDSLVRISPVTGAVDRVAVPAGLLEMRNGLASLGNSLITSDGTYMYNVSSGVNGVRHAGWTVRVFNPAEGWRLAREYTVEPTSTGFTYLHTDGVIADGRYLYLVEFGTGLTHRVRVVDAQDGHFVEEFESDQAETDLLNGQYDWTNNKVWFGQLNGPMVHRYAGVRLPEFGSLTSGPIGPGGAWGQLQVSLRSSETGRVEVDILGEDAVGVFRPLEGWTGLSPSGGIDLSPLGAQVRRLKVRLRLFGEGLNPSPGLAEWSVRYQPVSDLALSGLTAEPKAVQELEPVRLGVDVLNRGPLDAVRGASVAFYSGQPGQGRLIGRAAVPQQTPLGKKARVSFVWNTARFPGSNTVTARVEDTSGRPGLNAGTVALEEPVEVAPSGDADAPLVELTALDAAGEVRADDYLPSEPRFRVALRDSSGIDGSTVRIRLTGSSGETLADLTSPEVTNREGDETSLRFEYGPTLEDDRYELTVSGEDQVGNGPARKTLVFRVSSELRVEKALNVPNPMSDATEFTYILSRPASVVIRVYTVAGRLVRVLDTAPGRAGFNQIRWDGRDAGGHVLANGVYLYTVTADDGQEKARVKERLIVYR